MSYRVKENYINIVGILWMGEIGIYRMNLNTYNLEKIYNLGNGKITRKSIEEFLDLYAGDFQRVTDYEVKIDSVRSGKPKIYHFKKEESNIAFYN